MSTHETGPEEQAAEVLLPFVQKVCTCHMFSSDREPHRIGCETLAKTNAAASALAPLFAEHARQAWDEGYTCGNRHNGRRDANPYRERQPILLSPGSVPAAVRERFGDVADQINAERADTSAEGGEPSCGV